MRRQQNTPTKHTKIGVSTVISTCVPLITCAEEAAVNTHLRHGRCLLCRDAVHLKLGLSRRLLGGLCIGQVTRLELSGL